MIFPNSIFRKQKLEKCFLTIFFTIISVYSDFYGNNYNLCILYILYMLHYRRLNSIRRFTSIRRFNSIRQKTIATTYSSAPARVCARARAALANWIELLDWIECCTVRQNVSKTSDIYIYIYTYKYKHIRIYTKLFSQTPFFKKMSKHVSKTNRII